MTAFDCQGEDVLLTCAEMGQADAATIKGGAPGIDLMEAAGRAVAEEALRRAEAGRVVVLAGPGNNGGDGFVAARYLRAQGCSVRVALLGARDSLTGDAAEAAGQWDGDVLDMTPACLDGADIVIDAIFGAGLTRPVTGRPAAVIEAANALSADVLRVAVDVPSGLSGDDGQAKGAVFRADCTVTFFRRKPGHLLVPGRFLCGETVVRDIGIHPDVLTEIAPRTFANTERVWQADWPRLDPAGHKYRRGHVLAVSGRPPMLGAARLVALAALRAGAGLVTLAVDDTGYAIQASALREVMVAPCNGVDDLAGLLGDSRRNIAVIGPGAGATERTRCEVEVILGAGCRTVLDADALTAFADAPARLFKAIGDAAGDVVLTPHGGEFARLFGDPGDDKLTATRHAARRAGAVVVHKGPDTVIAAPDGAALIEGDAPPTLATAGSGDVLAGLVAGMLAQGCPPLSAAAMAVHLHGQAARMFGRGLIAGDIIDTMPAAMQAVDARLGV